MDHGKLKQNNSHETKVLASLVCGECDYQWEELVHKIGGTYSGEEDSCPMCGSTDAIIIEYNKYLSS